MLKSCWLCLFDGWTGSPHKRRWLIVGFRWALNWKTVILQPLTLGIGKILLLWGHLWTGKILRASPMFSHRDVFGHPAVLFFFPPGLSCLLWWIGVWQEVLQVLCFWQCRGQRSTMVNNGQHVVVCSRIHMKFHFNQHLMGNLCKSTPKLPNLEDFWGQHLAVGCVVQSLGPRGGPGGWESDQIRLGGALYRRRNDEKCKFGYDWLWVVYGYD